MVARHLPQKGDVDITTAGLYTILRFNMSGSVAVDKEGETAEHFHGASTSGISKTSENEDRIYLLLTRLSKYYILYFDQ